MDLEGSPRGVNWHLPEVPEETYGKYMWIRGVTNMWSSPIRLRSMVRGQTQTYLSLHIGQSWSFRIEKGDSDLPILRFVFVKYPNRILAKVLDTHTFFFFYAFPQ